MKKLSFILSTGVMILASCSSEDVVTAPKGDNAAEKLIGFNINVPNMGRAITEADGPKITNGLESETYDFAVWARKGSDQSSLAAATSEVMSNYMVGYYNGTVGYARLLEQDLHGTNWYYEGLGYDDHGFRFDAGAVQSAARTSARDHQYLKYWDAAATNTYFYAAAPYGAVGDAGVTVAGDKTTMTFSGMTMLTPVTYMYAYAECTNSSMIDNAKFVDLKFNRLGSKVRIAFYETIPGYDVELVEYSTTDGNVYAVPATKTGTVYSAGAFAASATPVVKFVAGSAPSYNYTYPAGTPSYTTPLEFDLTKFYPYDGGAAVVKLSDDNLKPIVSNFLNVVPADPDNQNSGFTLNVSFKLKSMDTQEVIYVRGARVFVPADYCQWLPNTLYTYVFKVTKSVPGNPSDPGTPAVDPTDPQLWPIIFNNIVIEENTHDVYVDVL